MIQRVQSIYLAIVAFISAMMSFIGVSIIDIVPDPREEMFMYLAIMIGAVWSLINYKNRSQQLVIDNITIVLNVLLIGVSVYYLLNLPGGDSIPKKGIWLIVPLINIILLILANMNIKKDIELVKSVDRIR